MVYENYEKCDMLQCYFETQLNSEAASELYFQRYPERQQPNKVIFKRYLENLREFGSFQKPRPKVYNKENIEVEEINTIGYICAYPNASSRTIRDNIGVNRKKIKKICRKYRFKQFRYRKVHALHDGDPQRRLAFCNWYLNSCRQNLYFFRKIIWTDEVRISSDGIYNRQNNLIWANENPHITVQGRIQGRYGFNVWCAIYNCRILCYRIFHENLTTDGYMRILEENLLPEIQGIHDIYFQQDGAPSHNAHRVRDILNLHFGGNWLGTSGPIRWPARSPDMTPMDFFLWGFLKNLIYSAHFNNINELERNFRLSLRKVSRIHLYNALRNIEKRCRFCIQYNGLQFENRIK